MKPLDGVFEFVELDSADNFLYNFRHYGRRAMRGSVIELGYNINEDKQVVGIAYAHYQLSKALYGMYLLGKNTD